MKWHDTPEQQMNRPQGARIPLPYYSADQAANWLEKWLKLAKSMLLDEVEEGRTGPGLSRQTNSATVVSSKIWSTELDQWTPPHLYYGLYYYFIYKP